MRLDNLVVIFNATPHQQHQTIHGLTGEPYTLHPLQAHGTDRTTATASYAPSSGTFTVPARTVAVFRRG